MNYINNQNINPIRGPKHNNSDAHLAASSAVLSCGHNYNYNKNLFALAFATLPSAIS